VNGDIRYIAMQVSGLEALQGASLTDSGTWKYSYCSAKGILGLFIFLVM
jgi:hypothetical protein